MEEARVRIRIDAPGRMNDLLGGESAPDRSAIYGSATRPESIYGPGKARMMPEEKKIALQTQEVSGVHRERLTKDEIGSVRALMRGLTGNRSLRPEDGILQKAIERAKSLKGVGLVVGQFRMAGRERDAVSKAVDSLADMRRASRDYMKKYGGIGQEPIDPKALGKMQQAEAIQAGAVRSAKAHQIGMGAFGAASLGVAIGLGVAANAPTLGAIASGLGHGPAPGTADLLDKFDWAAAGWTGGKQGLKSSADLSWKMAVLGQKIAGADMLKITQGLMGASIFDAYMKRQASNAQWRMGIEGGVPMVKGWLGEALGIR